MSFKERRPLQRGYFQIGLFCSKNQDVNRLAKLTPKCVENQVLGEERSQGQYIRGYHVYMTIWEPLASVFNAWKSQPRKLTRMLLLWFVLFLTVKKKWSTMWNKNLHDYIHASIPAPLRLDIFATWKSVGHGLNMGLKCLDQKRALNCLKLK